MLHNSRLFVIAAAALTCSACAPSYPTLSFTKNGDAFHLRGVIDADAIEAFDKAVKSSPETKTLIFEYVPGSADDESNLKLARQIRDSGFTTKINEDGLIASGGTDLFLAGVKREVSDGACIGVHSWGGPEGAGAEVPKDDPAHQLYLKYYAEIGIDAGFYWFTLDAASVDDTHWMTPAELRKYRITSLSSVDEADEPEASLRATCEKRINQEF